MDFGLPSPNLDILIFSKANSSDCLALRHNPSPFLASKSFHPINKHEIHKKLCRKLHVFCVFRVKCYKKIPEFDRAKEDRMGNIESDRSDVESIQVEGITIEWHPRQGTCTFSNLPVAMMWVDTTLAGVMAGVQATVGTERFLLALQSEGRKSIEADWQVISKFSGFSQGFAAIATIAAVAGWGNWSLISLDQNQRECRFRVTDNWEGRYQKALGVCWGSGMLAGKLAGYCSKLFQTNCWADQTAFAARGDTCDEFIVKPSHRFIETEIDKLLETDEATRADMAVALRRLEKEIAERHRMEEILRQSEEKFRNLVETTSDWIWETGPDGAYTYCSPAVRNLLGYDPEDVIGRNPFDFMPVDEAERVSARFSPFRETGAPFFNLVNRNRRKDGRIVVLETSGVPRFDSQGNLLGYRGIDRDITERQQTEEELRQKEEFIRALLDTSKDWIWAVDNNATHTYSNPAIRAILGYELDEIIGKSSLELISDEDRGRVQATFMKSIEERRGWSNIIIRWRHKAGNFRILESNSVPILDRDGNVLGFRGMDRDVTERMRAEAERLEMERRLLHTQKLESLGVLAGGIAHDFNNLLMVLFGNLELALTNLSAASSVRPYIEQALQAARRGADLTRQMLAYSGKGRFLVTHIDLSQLLRENVNLFRTAVPRNITMDLHLTNEPSTIEADLGQVQQIVMNLITNAAEAIGSRAGAIALTAGVQEFDETYLDKSRLDEKPSAGRFAYIEVFDTGCGMDDGTQQRLFDPFFSTKFTGRGLGMAAVLGIVRGHKGAIMVQSAPGKGTTIKVLFPYSESSRGSDIDACVGLKTSPAISSKWKRVLVVDDEDAVVQVCCAFVLRIGLQPIAASNGEEALSLLGKHADEIGCVLLDLTMPHMDGISTFKEMKRIRSDIPVILCSGYDELEATRHFAGEGLFGFIQKPFGLNDLQRKVERALKERE
jgi:PAS domain S-box-containing protein